MHWIKPEDRRQTKRRGFVMFILLLVALAFVVREGLIAELMRGGALYVVFGFVIGRETYFGTFRRKFLGVARGKGDRIHSNILATLTALSVSGLGWQLIMDQFGTAVYWFIFWWVGVFLATIASVRYQVRLERILLTAEWSENDPTWATARRLAEGGVRYEGRILRRLRHGHG